MFKSRAWRGIVATASALSTAGLTTAVAVFTLGATPAVAVAAAEVTYNCVSTGLSDPVPVAQTVKLNVELIPPAAGTVRKDSPSTVTWKATYVAGDELVAPVDLAANAAKVDASIDFASTSDGTTQPKVGDSNGTALPKGTIIPLPSELVIPFTPLKTGNIVISPGKFRVHVTAGGETPLAGIVTCEDTTAPPTTTITVEPAQSDPGRYSCERNRSLGTGQTSHDFTITLTPKATSVRKGANVEIDWQATGSQLTTPIDLGTGAARLKVKMGTATSGNPTPSTVYDTLLTGTSDAGDNLPLGTKHTLKIPTTNATVGTLVVTAGEFTIETVAASGGTPAGSIVCTRTGTGTWPSASVQITNSGSQTGNLTYTCTPSSGWGVSDDYDVDVTLTATNTSVAAGSNAVVRWAAEADLLTAPVQFPAGSTKVVADLNLTGAEGTKTVNSEGAANTSAIAEDAEIPLVSRDTNVALTKSGTTVITAGKFVVQVSGSGVSGSISCTIKSGTAPNVSITVTGAPTVTVSPTSTVTVTPSPATATATVTKGAQVRRTPKDGVATGGGGESMPSGTLLVTIGAALALAGTLGGLEVRRRRIQRASGR
ncbi:hypothetical protein [Rhizohabitans arisaemae]|uniref:hypothetical protein n=1 Tax=Rhizohabitans arisaemae TaxID=2720610 RepID=UPI0024B0AFE7|nr:hypothetical protein [Rhizohabitans arisaemae]